MHLHKLPTNEHPPMRDSNPMACDHTRASRGGPPKPVNVVAPVRCAAMLSNMAHHARTADLTRLSVLCQKASVRSELIPQSRVKPRQAKQPSRKWTSNDIGASPQIGKGGLPFSKPSVFPMSAAPPYAPVRRESASEHVPHALCEFDNIIYCARIC